MWYKKRKPKQYTWKNRGDDIKWCQINYILIKQKFRGKVRDVKTIKH